VKFVDDDGSIIVPKSVRPIIEYPITFLGNRCGALRQFRNGKLHIREYSDYYSVHSDSIIPIHDPLGHLLVDAPEYLVGLLSGISVYSSLKAGSANRLKNSRTTTPNSPSRIGGKGGPPPYIAAILAAYASYSITKSLKKLAQRRG
jgi:hypothetical protein